MQHLVKNSILLDDWIVVKKQMTTNGWKFTKRHDGSDDCNNVVEFMFPGVTQPIDGIHRFYSKSAVMQYISR